MWWFIELCRKVAAGWTGTGAGGWVKLGRTGPEETGVVGGTGGLTGSLSPSRHCSKGSKYCFWCGGWGRRGYGWGQEDTAAGKLWEMAE